MIEVEPDIEQKTIVENLMMILENADPELSDTMLKEFLNFVDHRALFVAWKKFASENEYDADTGYPLWFFDEEKK